MINCHEFKKYGQSTSFGIAEANLALVVTIILKNLARNVDEVKNPFTSSTPFYWAFSLSLLHIADLEVIWCLKQTA